jgi:hypothetical protein
VAEERRGDRWQVAFRAEGQELRSFDPMIVLDAIVARAPVLAARASDLYVVITELCANALEHGVLGLDSALKEHVDGFGDYYAQREQRLAAVVKGWLQLEVDGDGRGKEGRLKLQVLDSGDGFDSEGGDLSVRRAVPHGRGVELVRSLCDRVEYSHGGRCVTALYVWSMDERARSDGNEESSGAPQAG